MDLPFVDVLCAHSEVPALLLQPCFLDPADGLQTRDRNTIVLRRLEVGRHAAGGGGGGGGG